MLGRLCLGVVVVVVCVRGTSDLTVSHECTVLEYVHAHNNLLTCILFGRPRRRYPRTARTECATQC